MSKKILTITVIMLLMLSCGCQNKDKVTGDVAITQATPDSAEKAHVLSEYKISGFDIIYQLPELPTGCEITSLTMALNYYGLDVDKTQMATKYLPWEQPDYYYDENHRLIGNNLYNCFQGDPKLESGIICGPGAITTAANKYLSDIKSKLKAKDISGSTPQELYKLVSESTPVVVWTTISMEDRGKLQGWYTKEGEYVDWGPNDHCSVLIGYTDDKVVIADPLDGEMEYNRSQFESVFSERNNWCVVLE